MRLRKDTFRYIELEVYSYPQTERKLNQITDDIIHATPPYEEIRSKDSNDSTARKATILATDTMRMHMIDLLYHIDCSFEKMIPEIRDVLQDKYWSRPHSKWQEIADDHHVERRTIYRWRSALIGDLAQRMGLY